MIIGGLYMSNSNNKNKKSNLKPAKKQEKSRIAFLLVAVVLFIVILISTVFNDVVQIYRNKNQTEELNIRKQELLEEEKSLKSEVIKLQDPDYIARYAREKYLYTKEGERILTIIDVPKSSNKESSVNDNE